MANLPQILVDETDVGPRPVVDQNFNEIALVGAFNFGPVNTPTLVQSLAELQEQFGPTYESDMTGHLSAHGIYAQNGKASVWVVRVLPTSVAPVKASLTLSNSVPTVITTATAKAHGTEYNNVQIAIEDATNGVSTSFNARVTHAPTGVEELWENINLNSTANTLADVGGPNESGAGSELVVFAKNANGRPVNAAATNLASGTNGTAQASDYVGAVAGDGSRTGLYTLDEVPSVKYIIAAQQTSSTVHSGLQTYVAGRDVEDGQVLGIISLADNTAPADATNGSIDSMRLMSIWPFWKATGVPTLELNSYIAIDGHVAGRLSTLQAHESPSNKSLEGLVTPRYKPTTSQLETLVAARINAVTPTRSRGNRIRSGLTTSSDSAWEQWSIRNQYDRLEQLGYDALAWAVSEPNVASLRQQAADIMDAILRREREREAIVNFTPTVCDETNNTPTSIAAGRLNVHSRVRFAYPADVITLAISRDVA